MNIILIGDSGSGKSTIEKELSENFGCLKVVSCTTRDPRPGEEHGKDYIFVSRDKFIDMYMHDQLAEYDEYSQGRFYGSLKRDYITPDNQKHINRVVVLTPKGCRQLKRNLLNHGAFLIVYVKASLGNRMIRYIQRCGVEKFNFDDKNEICSRVDRDFGMFMGIEKEADLVVDGDLPLSELGNACRQIINAAEKKRGNL